MHWPEETLSWLTGEASEPSWVDLWDSAGFDVAGEEAERIPDRAAIRAWAAETRAQARLRTNEESWSHVAQLGAEQVAFQVHSPQAAGRWTGWTVAAFAPESGLGEADTWVRFEPQEPRPTRRWLVVTSDSRVVRIQPGPSGELSVRVERAVPGNEEAENVSLGTALVAFDEDRIDVAVGDVVLGDKKSRIKRLNVSAKAEGRGGKKVRVAVAGVASLRPRSLNLLTPVWPLVRPFASRYIARELVEIVRKVAAKVGPQKWDLILGAARLDKTRRGARSGEASG